ncbi:MAG: sodium:solute symporter [Candidatus Marinimicrobia bacterium]|nr:sodium:solute symporter [Candidatus Neomarinimicrobiota bacterium]MCF7828160.1 sodium:solute symporter [Candidatus Neomarinimicrobiota bacterium]MCF7879665.1 sodium:solute symporter [Candidatus Neomarinimicrobiota bacterium]
MTEPGWLVILPPVVAILLAMRTKQVILSLFSGIWFGWMLLNSWNPLAGLTDALGSLVTVFADAGSTRVILFSVLVGSLIALMQRSGGVEGFVDYVIRKKLITNRFTAQLLVWILGIIIFIESSIKILVAGAISRPLFDTMKISREKLSYILDSTSAPACMLVPLNAWGAFAIGLIAAQGIDDPVRQLLWSIPMNFYSIVAILFVLYIIFSQSDFGPMHKAETRIRETGALLRKGAMPLMDESITMLDAKPDIRHHARNMVIPVLVMVGTMPVAMYITGDGSITQGSGSTSVFWAVMFAIGAAGILYRSTGIMKVTEVVDVSVKGAGGMISLGAIMLLAFALGNTCNELGTGEYIASMASGFLTPALIPAVVFITAGFIAFSTGTSFGTFALMMPLALPLAMDAGVSIPLAVSAVLGGGVFGDHCSPISDTTVVASMAAATDHIDHVNTQIPYALVSAGIALVIYVIVGFIAV